VIQTMKLEHISYLVSSKKMMRFSHLVSLDMVIGSGSIGSGDFSFDTRPIFKAFGSKLIFLKVKIEVNPCNCQDIPFSFYYLQDALSFLTSLTSLTLETGWQNLISDISFLSHMKQLKSFCCNCIRREFVSVQELANKLLSCSELTHLSFSNFFQCENSFLKLKELFTNLEQSKIQHLATYDDFDIPDGKEYEFLELLNKMSNFQTIDITVRDNDTIHTFFGKWIYHLSLKYRVFDDKDIIAINNLFKLKSIRLDACDISDMRLTRLINMLSSRLESIYIELARQTCYNSYASFGPISKCNNLKQLTLIGFRQLKLEEFDLLLNCSQLELIQFEYCCIPTKKISQQMQLALKIPSFVSFPLLKTVHIDSDDSDSESE
jgi:hypothetical protein